jgi:hypothetical protein
MSILIIKIKNIERGDFLLKYMDSVSLEEKLEASSIVLSN